ncbi:hypothetical protein AB1Y20_011250 [Prymnesium parvum]|uniref:non-specific serine/threonine protein kinase n=1 Tax=Prymnesium parvum TaxID=97485 RepID=A0AB34IP29_PRYPA
MALPLCDQVRRCCHVLRDVLNIVLKSSPKKCQIPANAHEEMVCNHVTHLLSALFPVIRAGSEDALELLKLIGRSQDLPPRVRTQLQLLIPVVASGLQAVGLDFPAFSISLADTLIHFGNQLSETNGRRNLLLPLLKSLLCRLQEARASGELQAKYVEAAGDAMESHPLSRAVHSVAHSLQKLCRSDCSKELQILIAECLAVLVSCGLSARITAHAQVAAPFTSIHKIDDAYALVLHDALVLVLTQLHACLTDSDEMVMLMAVRALREIITRSSEDLSKALETLRKTSPLIHIELLVFNDDREKDAFSSVSAVATAASAALLQAKSDAARRAMDITSPNTWKIGNQSLDEWICNLACALLSAEEEQLSAEHQSAGIKGARSELKGADLKSCRLLATRRPAVAHACLFPALLNLLEKERRQPLEKEAKAADHPGRSDIREVEEAAGMAAIEPGPFERGLVIVLNQCFYDALHNGQDHSEKHLHAIGVLVTFVVQLYAQVKIELRGLNLTSVAKAAYIAGQPLSALMLLEIGSEESAELRPDTVLQDRERAQLLLDVLAALPAPDCAQGVQPPAADGAMGTLQSMQLRNEYAGCLALIDAIQESAIRTRSATLSMLQLSRIRALRNLGCEQLCAVALGQHMDATTGNAIIVDDDALVEACAESAWRLGRWQSVCGKGEVREGASLQSSGESFHRMLLAGLRAIAHGRVSGAQLALRDCACSLVSELGRAGDEGGKRAVTAMVRMRMCADVAEVARSLDTGWSSAATVVSRLTATGEHLEQWPMLESALLTSTGDDFETLEPVLALHHSLLRLACPPGLVHGLLHIAGSARRAERLPFSASFIAMADQVTSSELCFKVQWERAQLWHMEGLRGNHSARREAFKAANMLITKCAAKNLLPASELAHICWQTATWLASEPGADSDQLRQLFEKASILCNGVPSAEASEMHHAFAVWLESQHRASLHHQRSPAELCQQQASDDAERELKRLYGHTSSSDSGRISTLREIIDRQKQKVKLHRERTLELASLALRQHAACACKGGSHDQESLFGMVGLWLQYQCQQDHLQAEDEPGSVQSYVSDPLRAVKELDLVPSYKFLPLISQLTCYLGSQSSTDQCFQQALYKLLLRVARSHLHVVLPHLLALAHGNRFSPSEQKVRSNEEQLTMARKLLVQLREEADDVINSTQLLFDFYLQVAWVDINECKNLKKTGTGNPTLSALLKNSMAISEFHLESGETLLDKVQKQRKAQHAAVLTQEFNLEAGVGLNQVDAVTVASFSPPIASFGRRAEPQCGFAGGITLPRILRCWGSDNREYKQLVKGKDDLRGDAVMQQCFGLVNQLLRRDNASRQRGLRMRTYRVVPIAPTAGVLQWVGQTLPMSHYLFDIGAHARLRRDDMSFAECKQIMSDASNTAKHKEPKYRLEQYLKCTKAFRPVFHHFFLERWPQPAAWFARRLAYANSLATGSMVGYIVGLGDRHLSNILIDEATAELVHIDLGIAFEAGKLLAVPEMVPFRLTRDLEDGLGVCGVEGVMRSRAEQTLRVLRDNSNALLTVLQVFVRNPLYNWMQDPTRDSRRQVSGLSTKKENPNQQQSPNHDVERALLRIQQKLAGHVHGNTLSVEGQVRLLLDEARDPENLSRMFHGWAAWV